MSSDFQRESKAETIARIEREIERRRERGEPFEPLVVTRKKGAVAASFWGEAWGSNLESYSDYEARLPRGRTYLRGGHVFDLQIAEGEIFAYVTGAEIYEVLIRIDPFPDERWKPFKDLCCGNVSSVLDLLSGNLGPSVMEKVTSQESGLFPSPDEIHFSCSCPDWAHLCKHVAAVLYGVGVQLDTEPHLLFQLRHIDHHELIGNAAGSAHLLSEPVEEPGDQILDPENLSELFGIELVEPEAAFPDR